MQTHSAKAIPCLKEPWFKPHKSKMLGLLGYWQNSRTFEELPQALQTHLLSLKATPGTPLSEPLKELTQEKASIFLADFQNLHRINFTEPLVETRPPTMYDWFAEMGWIDKRGNTRGRWNDEPLAMTEAVRFLVDKVLKKDPRDIMKKDFKSNCLDGLLNGYYNNSPYAAISEAYPELNIKQWEMSCTPSGFYETKKNRIAAVKWLVEKLNKDPRDIRFEDFKSNRLGSLLNSYYNGCPYAALKEAGYNFHPWEMLKTPQGFFDSKKNRISAVKWLVKKLNKDPRNITVEAFKSNRLGGLLNSYYNNSPYAAISEAYPKLNIKQWEMFYTPTGFYETKKNRTSAVKWLVKKLNKDPRDITVEAFKSNRLRGLLASYYSDSPYEALKEAGLVTEADYDYMHNAGARAWKTRREKEASENAQTP